MYELNKKDIDRYSRQIMLEEIGYQGQIKLRAAKVCVVGVGGLGNPITTRLVAMGIGKLRIIDRDVIELSNLHRQTMFDESDVGQVKVEVAAKKLKKLNPDVEIEPVAVSINDYNADEVIDGFDVVIDALDSVNARYALNKACVKKNIPFVTGAAVGVTGQVFTVIPNESACYACVFPALDENEMPTCSIEGVNPPILSIIGAIEVSEAVKILLGKKPSLMNRILHIDLDDLVFGDSKLIRALECEVCSKPGQEPKPAQALIVEELCGRDRGKRTFSITPTTKLKIDVNKMTELAKDLGYTVDNLGELGLSIRNEDVSMNFMKHGSVIIVGAMEEQSAVYLYQYFLKHE